MKMKNHCLGYGGILVKLWEQISKNEKGMGILMDMFNNRMKGKACPKEWKMAVVCPMYKNKGKVKSLKTNICTILQVSHLPLHMFRLQQAIFRGSKFYICSTFVSSIISISYINIKQILNSQWIRISPLSAVQIYKIQEMSFTSLSCYMYKSFLKITYILVIN
jgi:hypothetical protein